MSKEKIEHYLEVTNDFSAEQFIRFAFEEFGSKVKFATSLGEEDQVITDMIAAHAPQIPIFTLDTGRLFQETYDLLDKSQKRYKGLNFEIYYPQTQALEEMVRDKGVNLFYESVDNRKECCHVRKVEPLQRALQGCEAWIVGLRRSQAVTRAQMQPIEWDEANGIIKIAPLAFWSLEDLRKYIVEKKVDVNPLHAQGFVSIGCAPCTRAIKSGDDIRSGRWWWETPEQKECGLHSSARNQQG